MSQYAYIFTAGGAARVNFLNQCVLNGTTDYLFEYLVMDYNIQPRKRKAIAIYNAFCAADAPHRLNCDEMLLPNARIHQIMAFYVESAGMNVLQKIGLMGLRSADRGVFDNLLPAVFRQEDSLLMNALAKVDNVERPTSGIKKSLLESWSKTKAKLIAAGCDCIRCTF